MLTKDHINTRRRGDKLFPVFLDSENPDLLAHSEILLKVFSESKGLKIVQLNEKINRTLTLEPKILNGLSKLLFDCCEYEESGPELLEYRWNVFHTANRLLKEKKFELLSEFQQALSQEIQQPIIQAQEKIYSDHPDYRIVRSFKTLQTIELLNRYNVAQVQGLLLYAHKLELKLLAPEIGQLRYLLRQLRFHQLLADIHHNPVTKSTELTISGPLSLFERNQIYGLKMANFLPHILNFSKWELTAQLNFQNKALTLKLDEKLGLKSHYPNHSSHIPEETYACMNTFNEQSKDVELKLNEEIINLGNENCCFPDLILKDSCNGKKIYIELFHPWHQGQALKRIQQVEATQRSDYKIGLDKKIIKNKELKDKIETSPWFAQHGFLYSVFPLVKHLQSLYPN
ncbi:MAG: DUF790 family protein [Oligoflexales bacterium]|nr:DUF790 family protein [Oligoflexales bacterium]